MNYSNKFYFLLLRTISEWATIFIEEPKYTNLYKNLEKKGVSFNFPIEQKSVKNKKIVYFKVISTSLNTNIIYEMTFSSFIYK